MSSAFSQLLGISELANVPPAVGESDRRRLLGCEGNRHVGSGERAGKEGCLRFGLKYTSSSLTITHAYLLRRVAFNNFFYHHAL